MPTINASRRDLASGLALLGLASTAATLAAPRAFAQAAPARRWRRAVDAAVKSAYDQFKDLDEGKNADYIPALAKVPSNYFGIALVTPQGKVSTVGDIDPAFSIQSISKVFTMALVFQESGEQFVENDVGVDATGQVFNSIVAIEQYKGKEMNPLVNPGAIATTGLVKGASADEVWAKIIGIHSDFAGRQLGVDQEVYKSESDTNQRNRAIGMLMSAYERFPSDPARAVDLYTRQCSIAVNAKDLGVMAATLANGGKNPVTGKQVIDPRPRARHPRGDGDGRPLRRQRQVAVPHRPAGQERRRRRPDRGLAGQVRDRDLRAAAGRGRQQRPRPARDHRHLRRARRQSLRCDSRPERARMQGQGGERKTADGRGLAAERRLPALALACGAGRPARRRTDRPGAGAPRSAGAQAAPAPNAAAAPITEAQRQHMEQELQQLLSMRGEFDQRIRALEVELHGASAASAPPAAGAEAAPDIQQIPAAAGRRRRRRSNGEASSPARASSS